MKIKAVDYTAFRNSAWSLFKEKGHVLVGLFILWQVLVIVIDVVRDSLLSMMGASASVLPLADSFSPGDFFGSLDAQFTGLLVVGLIFVLVTVLFNSFLSFGYTHIISEYVKNKSINVADLFHGFKDVNHWLSFFGATMLMMLAIYGLALVGFFAAFIVFGVLVESSFGLGIAVACLIAAAVIYLIIYLSINWTFAALAAVVDRKKPLDALRYSTHLVRNNRIQVVRIILQSIGWTLVGLLCLGVGILVAAPFVMILMVKYYRAFRDHDLATSK